MVQWLGIPLAAGGEKRRSEEHTGWELRSLLQSRWAPVQQAARVSYWERSCMLREINIFKMHFIHYSLANTTLNILRTFILLTVSKWSNTRPIFNYILNVSCDLLNVALKGKPEWQNILVVCLRIMWLIGSCGLLRLPAASASQVSYCVLLAWEEIKIPSLISTESMSLARS